MKREGILRMGYALSFHIYVPSDGQAYHLLRFQLAACDGNKLVRGETVSLCCRMSSSRSPV